MGGCTLNSCVRVSAIETLKSFKAKKVFEVIVDLSISGARIANYRRSGMFGGMSSVESAVREMIDQGLRVFVVLIIMVEPFLPPGQILFRFHKLHGDIGDA
jgi:hypothetical protein